MNPRLGLALTCLLVCSVTASALSRDGIPTLSWQEASALDAQEDMCLLAVHGAFL
jgi:hypothetical protein